MERLKALLFHVDRVIFEVIQMNVNSIRINFHDILSSPKILGEVFDHCEPHSRWIKLMISSINRHVILVVEEVNPVCELVSKLAE